MSHVCVNTLCYDCQAARISLMTSYLTIGFLPVGIRILRFTPGWGSLARQFISLINDGDGYQVPGCPWLTNYTAGICKKKLICKEAWVAVGGSGNLIKSPVRKTL